MQRQVRCQLRCQFIFLDYITQSEDSDTEEKTADTSGHNHPGQPGDRSGSSIATLNTSNESRVSQASLFRTHGELCRCEDCGGGILQFDGNISLSDMDSSSESQIELSPVKIERESSGPGIAANASSDTSELGLFDRQYRRSPGALPDPFIEDSKSVFNYVINYDCQSLIISP